MITSDRSDLNAVLYGALGPFIKDVRIQGVGVLSSTDKGEFFRYGRPHFLMQKTSNFLKFMVCPHGQGGLSSGVTRGLSQGGGQALRGAH